MPPGKAVTLGLISTKTTEVESKDMLKRRIEEAARFVPLDQLAISTQCGFSSGMTTAGGRGMTEANEIAKLRLVVEVAREVWN